MRVTRLNTCSWAPPLVPVARSSTTRMRLRFFGSGRRVIGSKDGSGTSAAGGIRSVGMVLIASGRRRGRGLGRDRLGGATHEDALHRLVDAAPLVLVRLVAAHQINSAPTVIDRPPNQALQQHDA